MSFERVDVRKLGLDPFTSIGDNWMLVTAKNKETGLVNTMTASWGGLGVLWNKDVITIYIRQSRYTKEFIDNNDYLTISFFDGRKKEMSLLGAKSGRDCDKLEEAGLNVEYVYSQPTFKEANKVLICKKLYQECIDENNFVDHDLYNLHYRNGNLHEVYVCEITQAYKKIS